MLAPFSEPQGAPMGTCRRPFGIIFDTFYMTWPDDLSRLLPAFNFQSKTTLQTSKASELNKFIHKSRATLVRSTSLDPFTYVWNSKLLQIHFTI